uniref:Uncharacterized protein n=1 Tax=Parascaris univalens TaxID=6257 RepID=A0A915B573_PARUN
ERSTIPLILLTAFALLFALISLIACLTGECWYVQILPTVGFVSGLFAFITLLASLCTLFVSTARRLAVISRASVMIAVFLLSLISGILFAVGVRVCVEEIFGSCYLFYYSKSFIVASVFAFLCALVSIINLFIVFCLHFRSRTENKHDGPYEERLKRHSSETPAIGTGQPISHDIRIARIARQDPLQTDL